VLRAGRIATGSGGSMGVTFKDNTIFSIGPDTELVVDEFAYEPMQGNLKLEATIDKGTLYVISGEIEKMKPEAVVINTPTGLIGVHGARFLARVDWSAKVVGSAVVAAVGSSMEAPSATAALPMSVTAVAMSAP
jgi:hypothetical protein